jgi:prepilin-type N-terminal cleavage/methylation domain-containing protein
MKIMKRSTVMQQLQTGFTLVEMAIVLMILALLLGGLLPTLSGQVEQRRITETNKQLDEIKEALIGFAIINGRLPCPATSGSNGVENPSGGGNCTYFSNTTNASNDYLPAVTLGLSGTDSSGLLEDAWGNPIRYAVTSWQSSGTYVFTSSGGMSSAGISSLSPNLAVCSTYAGISGSSCASGFTLTSNAVAVIYSTGRNGASGGTGADEAENLNPNATDNHGSVFVSHTPAGPGAANGEFDDIVIWISPNVLVNRMVSAGKLP